MAFLINRTAAARIECLHALARLIYNKFGRSNFALKDVKFDKTDVNIHQFCTLLQDNALLGKFCRFKDNPLDEAGCSITNGVLSDTTKSKEVSNTINAMHALGFIERDGRKNNLTDEGVRFAQTEYNTPEMSEIIKEALINYGPIIGVLNQLSSLCNVGGQFSAKDISVGYPSPIEYAFHKGKVVEISTGSKNDSNSRTKSCLLAWITTAGYIRPARLKTDATDLRHMAYRSYINCAQRNEQLYELIELPDVKVIQKPLNYENLTKMNTGLRERGMAAVREATMSYESIIKNRRFAIIYLLNRAYQEHKELPFSLLINLFNQYPEKFIVSDKGLAETIEEEIEIAYMAGIPYTHVYSGDELRLKPLQSVNMEEASKGAPEDLIEILENVKIDG